MAEVLDARVAHAHLGQPPDDYKRAEKHQGERDETRVKSSELSNQGETDDAGRDQHQECRDAAQQLALRGTASSKEAPVLGRKHLRPNSWRDDYGFARHCISFYSMDDLARREIDICRSGFIAIRPLI